MTAFGQLTLNPRNCGMDGLALSVGDPLGLQSASQSFSNFRKVVNWALFELLSIKFAVFQTGSWSEAVARFLVI